MAATPTNTPIPSQQIADLLYNTERIDEAVNSSNHYYTDRFGVQRRTIAGAMSSISSTVIRGAWQPATQYQPRDLVSNGSTWYMAMDLHTSGATFAADQAAHWRVFQGVLGPELADRANPLLGPGLVGYDQAIAYLSGTAGHLMRRVIYANLAGADAGGDVTSALNTSMALAVSLGAEYVMTPGVTYDVTSVNIPDGLKLRAHGATLRDMNGTASNTALVNIGDGVEFDELRVLVPAGKRRDRAVVCSGSSRTRWGHLILESVDQQNNVSDQSDVGVRIAAATDVEIGRITVINYDRAVTITGTTRVQIGGMVVSDYVRGVYLEDNKRLYIGPSEITGASVNATGAAGHNALLMASNTAGAQQDVTLLEWVIEDATEHGARIAGEAAHRSIILADFRVRNCGACGIKVLGTNNASPTAWNEDIRIINPLVEDCGSGAGLTVGENRVGIMLEFVRRGWITSPCVRKRNKAFSAAFCVRIHGCDDVRMSDYTLLDAEYDGIYLQATNGDNSWVTITGGIVRDCKRHGVHQFTPTGRTSRQIQVEGRFMSNGDSAAGTGYGAMIQGTGNSVACHYSLKAYANVAGAVSCNSSAVTFDGEGLLGGASLPTAAPGSTWRDGSTMQLRKTSGWVAL